MKYDYPDWRLPVEHIRKLAECFFPDEAVPTAVALAERESGGNTLAHNFTGEDSRGLWQINIGPNANPNFADVNLFDPWVAAWAAHWLWQRYGWRPWATSRGVTAGLWRNYRVGDPYPEPLAGI